MKTNSHKSQKSRKGPNDPKEYNSIKENLLKDVVKAILRM